jgi:hypothetical protein
MNLVMAGRRYKLRSKQSLKQFHCLCLINNVHSSDPTCIYRPWDARDLFENDPTSKRTFSSAPCLRNHRQKVHGTKRKCFNSHATRDIGRYTRLQFQSHYWQRRLEKHQKVYSNSHATWDNGKYTRLRSSRVITAKSPGKMPEAVVSQHLCHQFSPKISLVV